MVRLHLSQPGLIKKLIATAGLDDDDFSVYIPLRTDWSDEYQDAASLCTPTDNYRTLLGMAMFLLRTRPDIAHAFNILATRCAGATMRDLDSMLDLVRYLKRTRHLELIYRTGSHKQGILSDDFMAGLMLLTPVIAMGTHTLESALPTLLRTLCITQASSVPRVRNRV